MFVMIRSKFPTHKSSEVRNIWNKQPKPKPYVTHIGTFNRLDLENGYESYGLYEIEDGKYAEWVQSPEQTG